MDWNTLKPLDLSKINFIDFPENHYYREIYDKKQVVFHHTVSGPGIRGDLNTWLSTSTRIATCIIIDRDGTPNQMFSSKYWGFHTGKGRRIDQHSIGIEFDNWGGLIKSKDSYKATYGNKVDVPVTHYPNGFRGYEYYESYTDAQIQTAGELLLLWKDIYGIPLDYKEDMWDISPRALSGEPGVWAHVSFRPASDKQDIHPQPEVIEMFKSIGK
ncbi:MAG: N-acetylmuramoyl-L-alanine amidase [Chloroflexia bacterium]|nr:N-acetylmuramoyl-L-alanine amidase [Chloroflexia bacterium]